MAARSGMPAGVVTRLLERDEELARVRELDARVAAGAGSLVVVEAEAGLGKTRFLNAVADHAPRAQRTLLTASGGELERDFPFGVVRQLYEEVLRSLPRRKREQALAGAAALAAPLLMDGDPPPRPTFGADPYFSTLHGLYWLSANLAADQPLTILVDDAHWCDQASVRWLSYLGRRIGELPILVLVAFRGAEPGTETALLDALHQNASTETLGLAPLSETAMRELIAVGLDCTPDDEFVRAAHSATGGNPFLVHELIQEIAAEELSPSRESATALAALGPAAVSRALLVRAARISGDAVALAQAVAVLGSGPSVAEAAALAGLDLDSASEAAERLASARILAESTPLRFVHPIVRSAVYADLSATRRERLHAAAAHLTLAHGHPADRAGAHLLATQPSADPKSARLLLDAGRTATAHGAPDAAARFLRRALGEAPPQPMLGEILLELGTCELRVGAPEASDRLRRAAECSSDPVVRAKALRSAAMAVASQGKLDEALRTFSEAVEAVRGADRELDLAIRAQQIAIGQMDVLSADELDRLVDPLRATALAGATPGERAVLAVLAYHYSRTIHRSTEAATLAERALSGGRVLDEQGDDAPPFHFAVMALIYTDHVESARRHLDAALVKARARGSSMAAAAMLGLRTQAAQRAGNYLEAEADARMSMAVEGVHGPITLPVTLQGLIPLLIDCNRVAEAGEALAASGVADQPADQLPFQALLFGRALVRGAQGRRDEAVTDFQAGLDLVTNKGADVPSLFPWRSEMALACHLLRQDEEARRLADEELAMARELRLPAPLGIALRARALVDSSRDDQIELLRRAVELLAESPRRVEHARALCDLGAALRRAKQRVACREPLQHAVDIAHRCGATGILNRAQTELAATGARPRRIEISGVRSLTPSQRRVADMASSGMTNREIAQALFVTAKTVEDHLSHTYRKLSIRSRAALPRALADED